MCKSIFRVLVTWVFVMTLLCVPAFAETVDEVVAGAKKNRALVRDFRAVIAKQTVRFKVSEGVPSSAEDFSRTTEITYLFQDPKYYYDRLWQKKRVEVEEQKHTIQSYDGETSWISESHNMRGMITPGASSSTMRLPDRAVLIVTSDVLKAGNVPGLCSRPDAKILGKEGEGEDEVLLIETSRSYRPEKSYVRVLLKVLPHKGYLIQRAEFFDNEDRLRSVYEASDIRKSSAGGPWLAYRAVRAHYRYDDNGDMYVYQESSAQLRSFLGDPSEPLSTFRLDFPPDFEVIDERGNPES